MEPMLQLTNPYSLARLCNGWKLNWTLQPNIPESDNGIFKSQVTFPVGKWSIVAFSLHYYVVCCHLSVYSFVQVLTCLSRQCMRSFENWCYLKTYMSHTWNSSVLPLLLCIANFHRWPFSKSNMVDLKNSWEFASAVHLLSFAVCNQLTESDLWFRCFTVFVKLMNTCAQH